MEPKLTIGVLALQGAFAKHCEMLQRLSTHCIEVRTPEQLQTCDGLILPGGESTTMTRLLRTSGLLEALRLFGAEKPLFGTCAGCILMAMESSDARIHPLGLIDMHVERNAFGRQSDSFCTQLTLRSRPIPGTFIRAPRIRSIGTDVTVHCRFGDEAVLVQQGKHLASTFHPELSKDPSVHQLFLDITASAARSSSLHRSGCSECDRGAG